MPIDNFQIRKALSFNNGNPGGREYWLVYLGDNKTPWVGESFDEMLSFVKDRAIQSAPRPIPMRPLECKNPFNVENWTICTEGN